MTIDKFKSLLESGKNYVVVIGAEWCSSCKVLHRSLDTISDSVKDYILEVDVVDCGDFALEWNIMSVPTVFYISDGRAERKTGVQSKAEIVSFLS